MWRLLNEGGMLVASRKARSWSGRVRKGWSPSVSHQLCDNRLPTIAWFVGRARTSISVKQCLSSWLASTSVCKVTGTARQQDGDAAIAEQSEGVGVVGAQSVVRDALRQPAGKTGDQRRSIPERSSCGDFGKAWRMTMPEIALPATFRPKATSVLLWGCGRDRECGADQHHVIRVQVWQNLQHLWALPRGQSIAS